MAVITSNMGLRSWPDSTDKFSFADLAANFTKIDNHTHESGRGVQLGTSAFPNSVASSAKIGSDLRETNFATGALTMDKFTGNPLAVPRRVLQWHGFLAEASMAASTTYVGTNGASFATIPVAAWMWTYNSADYAVPGLTTQLTFKGSYSTNPTAGGTASITFGLFPVTTIGGASSTGPQVTALGASLHTFTVPSSPAISTTTGLTRASITAPADGTTMVFGIQTSAGTLLSGAVIQLSWMMGIRWV